jgi:hypothetical protein
MWRNVRARFDALHVTNVVWFVDYMNSEPYNCLIDQLYPGDRLVDWVMFNGYQHGDQDVDFVSEVSNLYDLLTRQSRPGHDYLSKPWGIVEWGINNSTQESAYLFYAQARAAIEADVFPRLHLFAIFDNGNYQSGDFSHRVGYDAAGRPDPLEQRSFNELADSWAFRDPGLGNPKHGAPPSGLVASSGGQGVVLGWRAPNDRRDPVGYDVYRDGVPLGTAAKPEYVDRTAQPGAVHVYSVRAVWPGGIPSPVSPPITHVR